MATFYNQARLSYNNITVNSNIVSGEITDTLSVTKTAVDESYTAGSEITYVISLVNSGDSALNGITLTDDLGAYLYGTQTLIPLTYVPGSAKYFSGGSLQPDPTVTADGTTVVITGISVPANGNASIIYQANANEYAPLEAGSEITNTVTASGLSITGDITASAAVPAESEAVLSVSKALSPSEIAGGGQITYTFTIRNTGSTAENTAVLTDTFDPVLSDIAVSMDGAAALTTDYNYDETTGEFTTTSGALVIPAASYTRDPDTGAYIVVPGTLTMTVTGTV